MKTGLLRGTKIHAMTTPRAFSPVRGSMLQRKCACGGTPGPTGECEACRKKKQQHRPSNLSAPSITSHVPPIVQEVLRSPGQPLDRETRVFMESRFGQDFSRVRLHTDGRATDSVRLVNALAYTVGHHIAVRSDQYAPGITAGRRLLAHELAHVVQQSARASESSDPELRANVAAQRIIGGQQVNPASVGSASVGLYRQLAEPDQDWFLKLLSLKSQLHAISLQTAIRLSQEKKRMFPASSPLFGQSSPSFSMVSDQTTAPIDMHLLAGGQGKKSGFGFEKGRFEARLEKAEESQAIGPQNEEELSFLQQRLKDALESLSVVLKWTILGRKGREKKREQKKLRNLKAGDS